MISYASEFVKYDFRIFYCRHVRAILRTKEIYTPFNYIQDLASY